MKLLNEAGKACTTGCINTSVGTWAKTLAKKFQEKKYEWPINMKKLQPKN